MQKDSLYNPKHCVTTKNGSCLDEDLIRKVAKIFNQKFKTKIDETQSCSDIHSDISRYLRDAKGCQSESCMLQIDTLMKSLGKDKKRFVHSFQAVMPKEWLKAKGKTIKKKRRARKKKKSKQSAKSAQSKRVEDLQVGADHYPKEEIDLNALLSTDEIEDFLDRLEEKYSGFVSFGATPIDFSNCNVDRALCKFECKDHLDKGDRNIGVVFNTDPHDKDGEHWIALYIDLRSINYKKPAIYYFDSYGYKPPSRVKKFIDKVREQGESCHHPFKYYYNDYPYQRRGTQCGMYAIHFLNEMASGVSFQDYLNSGVGDMLMKDLRDDYFIDPNEM